METKLSDPDCTCSAFIEQWSMWTLIHICGLRSTIVDYGSYGLNSIYTPQSHSFTGLLDSTLIQRMKAN